MAPRHRSRSWVRSLRILAPWLAVGAFFAALAFGRRSVQRRHLYRPGDGEVLPWAVDPARREIRFRAPGGPLLRGIWWPAPDDAATVIFCHGQRGTLDGMETELARIRRRLGVNLLAFDYRGYGASAGTPSEVGLYADARAAFDHAVGALGVRPGRIVLFGHSLGSAVAIDTALDRPVAGLIVQSAFTNVRDMARVKFPGWPVHWIARNEFRSIDKVPVLTLPKLFVHGEADRTVPLAIAHRLYEAAAPPKGFVGVAGADHNEVARRGGLRWAAELRRFVVACTRDSLTP